MLVTRQKLRELSTCAFESGTRGAIVIEQISAFARVVVALKRAFFLVVAGSSGCWCEVRQALPLGSSVLLRGEPRLPFFDEGLLERLLVSGSHVVLRLR